VTKNPQKSRFWTVAGWLGLALFAVIYLAEFLPRHGPPVTVEWIRNSFGTGGLIVINIVIVLAFIALLPYRHPNRSAWKSHGVFAAFVIALMTEMFGWPLVLFLLSPLVEVPSIAHHVFHRFGHTLAHIGTGVSLMGVVLIGAGWVKIHRAEGLVDDGIYQFMRHPQYTGIFLFTFGWILHWPSVITLALWPILIAAYVWLALQEEKHAHREYGEAYARYAARVKRFIPGLI